MTKRIVLIILCTIIAAAIAAAIVLVLNLDESRRRYIAHLIKQVPALPGRYYI